MKKKIVNVVLFLAVLAAALWNDILCRKQCDERIAL